MKIDEKALEAAARALCIQDDVDPDGVSYDRTGRDFPNYYVVTAEAEAAITAYISAIEEAGFVVVPREPTEAMFAKGQDVVDDASAVGCHPDPDDIYRAMLAAKDAT